MMTINPCKKVNSFKKFYFDLTCLLQMSDKYVGIFN